MQKCTHYGVESMQLAQYLFFIYTLGVLDNKNLSRE